nr:D-2-hydroxyacid dehydrogenase [Nakamurella flavida]
MAAGGGSTVKAAELSPEALAQVTFTTAAGVHGGPLAEFALFGVLAGFKGLDRLQRDQAAHHWPAENYLMRHIAESTVAVIGLGGIGQETARLLNAFGATVLGVKRAVEPVEHVDEVFATADLPTVVGRADAVVITLPGTEQTENLYDAAMIAATKPGAVLVNVGRGSVVDEAAMIAALRSGHLSAAYLDVVAQEPLATDSPLWEIPSVVIAPHTAALSVHQDRQIAELFADNLAHFLRGEPMRNVVDTQHFY